MKSRHFKVFIDHNSHATPFKDSKIQEFGQGVRQQRVRDKTKEKAGTLPLSLSMIRRVQTNQTQNVVDMLEELQALDAGQPETAQIETRPVRFSKGDVVALKHNWKRYLEPFFLAILQEDLHCSNGGILERTMRINWLEPSEERIKKSGSAES